METTSRTRRTSKTLVIASALASFLVMGIVVASPALAWIRYYATVDALALRSGPSTSYTVLQRVNRGTPLDASCGVIGQNINGNAVWLRLTGGQHVSDYYTNSDGWGTRLPTGLPSCSASVGESGARAAEARLGQVYTSENPNAGWWSGWCETFVEVAYGRRFRYASAIQHYYARRDAGQIRTGVPPRGAIVFYGGGGGFGHTGVAVGSGYIVSTLGYSNQRLPVSKRYYTYFASYLGWARPYG